MGGWSLRKASSKLQDEETEQRPGPREPDWVEMDVKHTTLTATFSPIPTHCAPWLSLDDTVGQVPTPDKGTEREKAIFCVNCI